MTGEGGHHPQESGTDVPVDGLGVTYGEGRCSRG
jgi:hypothetical protein